MEQFHAVATEVAAKRAAAIQKKPPTRTTDAEKIRSLEQQLLDATKHSVAQEKALNTLEQEKFKLAKELQVIFEP